MESQRKEFLETLYSEETMKNNYTFGLKTLTEEQNKQIIELSSTYIMDVDDIQEALIEDLKDMTLSNKDLEKVYSENDEDYKTEHGIEDGFHKDTVEFFKTMLASSIAMTIETMFE